MENSRFKFRVWDKSRKEMITEVTNLNPVIFDEKINPKANDYVIMQSTGLKDRNKKLIYEGDIVEFMLYNEKIHGEIIFILIDCIMVIKTYRSYYKKHPIYEYLSKHEMTVIGNIYENAELLESKNETR